MSETSTGLVTSMPQKANDKPVRRPKRPTDPEWREVLFVSKFIAGMSLSVGLFVGSSVYDDLDKPARLPFHLPAAVFSALAISRAARNAIRTHKAAQLSADRKLLIAMGQPQPPLPTTINLSSRRIFESFSLASVSAGAQCAVLAVGAVIPGFPTASAACLAGALMGWKLRNDHTHSEQEPTDDKNKPRGPKPPSAP
jgi:hypothetical protein